jgi:methanethiol oxidase
MNVENQSGHEHSGPGYASPPAAREQPPEKVLYVAALYEGPGIARPDFIAVVDVDPSSSSYPDIHLPGGDCTTETFQ